MELSSFRLPRIIGATAFVALSVGFSPILPLANATPHPFSGPDEIGAQSERQDGQSLVWGLPTRHPLKTELLERSQPENASELWTAPETVSRRWLERAGLSGEDLEWVATHPTPRILYVHFRQRSGGLPLDGSRITLQWDRAGHLVHSQAQIFVGLAPRSARAHPATFLSREDARAEALAQFPNTMQVDRWLHEEMRVRPEASTNQIRTFWSLEFSASEPAGWFEVWVDATSGKILREENLLRHGNVTGRVAAEIEPITSGDPAEELAIERQDVRLQGDSFEAESETDEAGRFSIEAPDGPTYQLIHTMEGAVKIVNVRDDDTPADTLAVTTGSNTTHIWNDDNSRPADRDAYYHGTIAYETVRALDDSDVLSFLDDGITLRVDDTSNFCNAFWNGTSITFYAAGGGCVAAARIADIVYHEYGHAIATQIYRPFRIPRDMDEAWSDYFAATIGDSPLIGRGFLGVPGTFVRELETDLVWPEDNNVDPHLQGLILAGALWDLRERLGAEATDPLFHFARYGLAESFDDYMLDLLRYDDDDGDLTNGTPNFHDIIGAFRPHGIGDYDLTLEAVALPDVEEIDQPIEGELFVRSLLGLDPDSLSLFFRLEGESGFTRIPLQSTSVRQRYSAAIPPPPAGSTVQYYWSASDTSGNSAALPENSPEEWLTFRAGPDETPPSLQHTASSALTEDQTTLQLATVVDDNSGRLQSVWVDVTINEAPALRQELDRTSAEGVRPMLYRTTLDLGSPLPGDVLRYRLGASDDSRAENVGLLPLDDWFEVTVVPGQTLDFELGPSGLTAFGDWEWGEPIGIPAPADGARVWGTVLDGPYRDDLISVLIWGPLETSTFESARLEIEHYFDFVAGNDGARVTVSDDGESWASLIPGAGYPFGEVSVFGGPGFSGRSDGWESTTFSLDNILSDQLWVRFETQTDPFASDLGWYLNKIRLANVQALIPPFQFQATSGESERVQLSWRAPRGIDLFSGRFLGYQIYRAQNEGPFEATPIHPEPLIGTQFVDRAVENDQVYRYRIEALYTEGASPPVLITAEPAAPQFVLDATEVDYTMRGVAESDTTLFVRNFGRGILEFDVFIAEFDASLDDVRIEVEMANITETEQVVVSDPADAFGNPDIESVSMRRLEDDTFGPMIEFTLQGHGNWGDSGKDFGGVLFMDTDQNLATRPNQSFGWDEQRNIGWESIVLFGSLTRDLGSNAPALFFDACCLDDAVVLERRSFPESGSVIRFSVPVAQLGNPEFLQLSLILASAEGALPFDRVPETPDLPWLIREPRHGRAEGGRTEFLSFQFDATERGNGVYQARAFVRTNDPALPLINLPITLNVDGILPGSLSSLSLRSVDDGIDIVFALPLSSQPDVAQVQRKDRADDRWSILTQDPLSPDPEGRFFFVDKTVDPGFDYDYRFRVLFSNGTTVTYGPFETTYRRAVPTQLGLQMDGPNPFSNETAVLLELPDGGATTVQVFDASGRRIQDLRREDLLAGVYKIVWDGRLEAGESAPSGVYFVLAQTPSGRQSLRLLRIR